MAARSHLALLALAVALAATAGCRKPAPTPKEELTFSLGTNIAFVRGLLEHYNTALPGVHVTAETSYGAYVVAADLQEGRGDIGIAQADAVYLSYRRGSTSRPIPHTELRGMAVLGVNPAYILAKNNSRIASIEDLRGRRVGLLERGTSSEGVARILFEAGGLGPADLETVSVRFAPGVTQLTQGALDALIIAAPMDPSFQELLVGKVKAISLSPEIIDRLETRYPFLRAIDVPAARLWGQREPVHSVAADAILICRRELRDDLVYQLTRELFAVLPALSRTYPEAAEIDPALAATTPIPLHRGAARYYRERELLK